MVYMDTLAVHLRTLATNGLVAIGPVVMLATPTELDWVDNQDGTVIVFTGCISQVCKAE